MPIYKQIKNGKTTYTVLATQRINGKQVNRKRRNITSIAQAKRIEVDLKVELRQLKETPHRYTLNDWSKICIKKMQIQFKVMKEILTNGSTLFWVSFILIK